MDDLNRAVGVGRFIVAGRWNGIGLNRQHTGNKFQHAASGPGMTEAYLWCGNVRLAQFRRNRLGLGPVHGNCA